MRKAIIRVWLVLFLVLPLGGQSTNWKRYENKEGNFAVLFPGEPKDSINQSDSTIQSHTLMAQEDRAVYTVIYSAMSSDQKVDGETYDRFRKAVFAELPKCEVESEEPASLLLEGYIGHWYRLNCSLPNTKVMIRGNLYWGKRCAYAVMVMYPEGVAQPAASMKFVDSFSVLSQGK